jgi:Fe2+ or Zn2+ uptake regulation protein
MMPHAAATDSLRSTLEAAGWRWTRQRQAVYEFLVRSDPYHPTADEVFRAVKDEVPRISLATVYKALETLEEAGLVTRLPAVGDGPARFDARLEPHYHLRCMKSGRVDDLPTPFDPELIARLDPDLARRLEEHGFHVTGYRLELVGYYDQTEPSMGGA